MNNLIKINLLPYREEMNKRKQQQFKTLMYGAVLTGVAAGNLPVYRQYDQ